MPKGIPNKPIAKGSMIGTDDGQTGQDLGAEITATGQAQIIRDVIPEVEVFHAGQVEDEKFMNEFIEVVIEEDDDPNAAKFIYCGHNGIPQYIQRGEIQRVRRKFLYSLLAAKRTSFACSFGKDGNGEAFNRLPGTSRTTYRLHVNRDDNPKGRKWFLDCLASA